MLDPNPYAPPNEQSLTPRTQGKKRTRGSAFLPTGLDRVACAMLVGGAVGLACVLVVGPYFDSLVPFYSFKVVHFEYGILGGAILGLIVGTLREWFPADF